MMSSVLNNNKHAIRIYRSVQGQSLLEVMVGIAIGSLVTLALYQSLNQTTRVVNTIDGIYNQYSPLALFLERFEKDVTSAWIPFTQRISEADQKSKKDQEQTVATATATQGVVQAPRKLPDLKSFVLANMTVPQQGGTGAGTTMLCTFITTAPLLVYGEQIPRLVRVMYSLAPASGDKNFWTLTRSESQELSYDKFLEQYKAHKISQYPVLPFIKSLTIRALVYTGEQTATGKTTDKTNGKISEMLKELSGWDSQEQKKENKRMAPDGIRIRGVIGNPQVKRETSFEFIIPILADSQPRAAQVSKAGDHVEGKEQQESHSTVKNGSSSSPSRIPRSNNPSTGLFGRPTVATTQNNLAQFLRG